MMGTATVIASCLDYPHPGHLEALRQSVDALDDGAVRRRLEAFVGEVGELELGAWEELHTRTLDLSPSFVPYIGHVIWGESYRRGAFMADLNREMIDMGVDRGGELPDHLAPVLRYLDVASEPNEELLSVLPRAVDAMSSELKDNDRSSPYRHVLSAVSAIDAASADDPKRSTHAHQ